MVKRKFPPPPKWNRSSTTVCLSSDSVIETHPRSPREREGAREKERAVFMCNLTWKSHYRFHVSILHKFKVNTCTQFTQRKWDTSRSQHQLPTVFGLLISRYGADPFIMSGLAVRSVSRGTWLNTRRNSLRKVKQNSRVSQVKMARTNVKLADAREARKILLQRFTS
jgi:hypothetical protein